MFVAALFIIVPNWEQSKYLPTREWINKLWYIQSEILVNNEKE